MNDKTPGPPASACPDCGGDNRCTKDEDCWCMTRPRLAPVPASGACRCERCLDRLAEETGRKPAG